MARSPRRSRALALVPLAAATLALTGCLPPPPHVLFPQFRPPAPSPQPLPSQPSPSLPATTERVQPDSPASDIDGTAHDTGELYAGEAPITSHDYSPDAGVDVVLQPTRGTPIIAPGVAVPDDQDGDEYMPNTPPSIDGDLVQSTVGLLWMTDVDGSESTCSGTVINSATDNIVITAAHCLWSDDSRRDYVDIAFIPAYREGTEPFGRWRAETHWVPQQYLEANGRWLDGEGDNGWMGFDFGFVRLAANDAGQEIEQVVGGQGVSFTAETNGALLVGYPGNGRFDAERQRFCADATLDYGAGGDPNYGMDCVMGSGASGSGWVSNLDPATGAGLITAVYSNGTDDAAYGPPLGVTAYNGLVSISPGS